MFLGKSAFSEVNSPADSHYLDENSGKSLRNLSGNPSQLLFRHSNLITLSQKKSLEPKSKCLIDSETLQFDNILLKNKLTDLESENMLLKNKILEFEQLALDKEKTQECFLLPTRSAKQVPNLKIRFKECRSRLMLKESLAEELKVKTRTKRVLSAEDEIQKCLSECVMLKKMLIYALGIVQIPKQEKSSEERLAEVTEEMNKLKEINKEYLVALEKINDEIFGQKSRERFLEKTRRKKLQKMNAKMAEYKKIKSEVEDREIELELQKKECEMQEKELRDRLKGVNEVLEDNVKRLLEMDMQLKRRTEENEKTKNLNTSYKNALRRARTLNIVEEDSPRKLKNPPKFFKRIHKIITKKNMMIEVFLSLFDKYNKRVLTVEELFKAFQLNISGMKRKYIENALLIMGCHERYVSLDTIGEWYTKYDYDGNKEEEIDQTPKLNPHKRNTFFVRKPTEDTLARKIQSQLGYLNYSKITQDVEDRFKIGEQLMLIFEEITFKMEKMRIPKAKITETLFGEDFDETQPIFCEDLESRLAISKLDLKDPEKNQTLAKFLCEPEINSEDTEKSQKFSQISHKLKKYTQDWEVYTDSQRLRIKLIIYKQIKKFAQQILKTCKEKTRKVSEKISWTDFKEAIMMQGVDFQDEIWRFWSLKFYPEGKVDYRAVLRKFKTSFPAIDSINLVKERKKYRNLHVTDIFNIDISGTVTIHEFCKNIKKLYLGLHSKDILELISYIQDHYKSYSSDLITTAHLLEIFH